MTDAASIGLGYVGAMAVRYDDTEKTLALSVRDLVEEGAPSGHLTLEVVQSRAARAEAGRRVHVDWQEARQAEDEAYRPEVRLSQQVAVGAWTCLVQGRVDGLVEEDGHTVVEEVKSTVLDAGRLYATGPEHWPAWVQQLEVYLWMLHAAQWQSPVGRLVLVSLADGSRHVLGVGLDVDRVGATIRERLTELVEARERRLAWLASRRERAVPVPHGTWRPGQREIAEAVHWGLDAGHQVLVEAPTGLGKTAAVLAGVLRHALAHDKQVFWATARTTQQAGVRATLGRLAEAGLPLRTVTLQAKDKACLNDVVACRPERCGFAEHYYDKLREAGLLASLAEGGATSPELLAATGERYRVCPFELALDLSSHVDVVVGDYNYVFDPSVHLRRHFADAADGWVVVVDEAHQLVERARGWGSPRLEAALARQAADRLAEDPDYGVFASLAERIALFVEQQAHRALGRSRGDLVVAAPDLDALAELAAEVDAVGLDYALLKASQPLFDAGERDPWLEVARGTLRLSAALAEAGEESVPLAGRGEGRERLGLICLDPSPWLGPRIGRLGGFVGLSATLSPDAFYRDLLGLDARRLDVVRVPSPFPPERRRVVVAPRVSTAWRDREAHAAPTAALVQRCVEAVPGNVAVYFSSFEMLEEQAARWSLPGREVLLQAPGASDAERSAQLARLGGDGPPVVLGAVLGGVFAEGIDLPPGALDGVIVVGPGFPPVGLERDLLKEACEARFGAGFLYSSLVPAITRVVQAAGRLIRRPEDRGVVVLVGRRFRWRDVQALLPHDWGLEVAEDPAGAVAAFFEVD